MFQLSKKQHPKNCPNSTIVGVRHFFIFLGRIFSLLESDPEREEAWNTGCRKYGIHVRFSFFAILMICSMLLIFVHIFKMQVLHHKEYRVESQKSLLDHYVTKKGWRGRILDHDGNVFASGKPTYDIFLEPRRFKDRQSEVCSLLKFYLKIPDEKIAESFNRGLTYHVALKVASGVDQVFADAILQRCKEGVKVVPLPKKAGLDDTRYKVLLYPKMLSAKELKKVTHFFCQLFSFAPQKFEERIERNSKLCVEVPLERNIPLEAGQQFLKIIYKNHIGGIRLSESWERTYPRDAYLANVLGYLDYSEQHGISGIEKLMDRYMQPVDGKSVFKYDRRGCPVEEGEVVTSKAENGADIYLTIQEPLQQIAEEELTKLYEEYHPDHAFALMFDPRTGAIMALAQFPQFNPNDRKNVTLAQMQNHILVQSYEPGSIMKPFTASLAIENRAVQINSKVFCENGRWYYGGRPLRDTSRHGDLTVAEILQKSSNIGAAKLAVKIGEQKLYDGLHEFGFGQRSRLGFLNSAQKELSFIGETPGMFKNVRSWDKVTVTRMAIGQGLTVTVLQLAQAWGALANHGTMMHLYLVDRVVYANNEMQCSVPQEMSQPVSPETADAVTQALKLVTQKGGTGGRAAVPGYYVAGKTGTGQQWVSADKSKGIRGHYSNYDYFSSFIGYVPADNPEFVLLVCADRPKAKYARLNNGGYVSAPTFREIARRTLEYLRVPKDYDPDMHDKKLTPTYYRRNTTASQ